MRLSVVLSIIRKSINESNLMLILRCELIEKIQNIFSGWALRQWTWMDTIPIHQ